MKDKIVFTFLLIVLLLIGCNSQPNSPTLIPSIATPFSKSPPSGKATVTPLLPTVTSTPKHTQTIEPDKLVSNQDGQEFMSSQYGFTIIFPADMEILTKYSTNNAPIAGYLPQKHLTDGGDIVTWFEVIVENQIDGCPPILKNSIEIPTELKQVTLGSTPFSKIYTPTLYGDYMQGIEYIAYGTDFCIHFYINLTTYYFDREMPRLVI